MKLQDNQSGKVGKILIIMTVGLMTFTLLCWLYVIWILLQPTTLPFQAQQYWGYFWMGLFLLIAWLILLLAGKSVIENPPKDEVEEEKSK